MLVVGVDRWCAASVGRLRADRRRLRRDLDRGDALSGIDRFQAQALDLITSPRVRDAFDLSKEPERVLAGLHPLDVIAVRTEPFVQERRDALFVLNDQEPHRGILIQNVTPCPGRWPPARGGWSP